MLALVLVTEAVLEPLPEPELPEPVLPDPDEAEGAGVLELEELVFFFFVVLAAVVLVLEVELVFFLLPDAVVEVLAGGAELAEALGVAAGLAPAVLLAVVSVLAVLELKPASAETWVPTA